MFYTVWWLNTFCPCSAYYEFHLEFMYYRKAAGNQLRFEVDIELAVQRDERA